jgi:hypothetical protein
MDAKSMDLLQVFVGVALAILGWVIGHRFTSARDVNNSQRAVRVAALTEAYRALVRSGIDGVMIKRAEDGNVTNGAKPVEDAIALVHLYGTQEQSVLASKYATQVANEGGGDATKLVNALRKEIRENLGGCDVEAQPCYLRVGYQDTRPSK